METRWAAGDKGVVDVMVAVMKAAPQNKHSKRRRGKYNNNGKFSCPGQLLFYLKPAALASVGSS